MNGWFKIDKSVSMIKHINRIWEKNDMIRSIDTEKPVTKSNILS
jgi:hypothetical protein